jgi:alkylation response protein AidB-like acyl-CoA dehydrogenase
MFRTELDRLVALAQERGATADPSIRQRLAACHTKVEIMRYLGLRSLTQFLGGHQPGPESGTFKLYWSQYHQELTELAIDVLGPDAMTPEGRWPTSSFQTDSPGAPNHSASWVGSFYNARAGTIYAGSSEIQRNIVGEMVLGLPKEPRGADSPSWRDQQAARS